MLTVAALYHFAPLPDPAALRAPLLALCEAMPPLYRKLIRIRPRQVASQALIDALA